MIWVEPVVCAIVVLISTTLELLIASRGKLEQKRRLEQQLMEANCLPETMGAHCSLALAEQSRASGMEKEPSH